MQPPRFSPIAKSSTNKQHSPKSPIKAQNMVRSDKLVALVISLSIALAVLGFRMATIHEHGLQYPINDQWHSEYSNLYKPYLEGKLSLGGFFAPNNEHVIALQKVAHLGLFLLLGEWSPMVQMYFNALLFSLLVFVGSLLAGLRLGGMASAVVQSAILLCGLMPGPAENFLFGFQTGWYFYYFTSGIVLLCLAKSEKLDVWWCLAWVFAILSCLSLASGVVNLVLCIAAPATREWLRGGPGQLAVVRLLPCVALSLPPLFFFASIIVQGRPESLPSETPFFANLIAIFSYPWVYLPITYLPVLGAVWTFVARLPSAATHGVLGFSILFAIWGMAHSFLIGIGRGGVSSRHVELLLLGALANILLVVLSLERSEKVTRPLVRAFRLVWLSAIFGGLAFQLVASRKTPEQFFDFFAQRYELVKESLVKDDSDVLASRSWVTGLPANLFATHPELIRDPLLREILPAFFPEGIQLSPPPEHSLIADSTKMFPTAFPFLPWAKVENLGGGQRSVDFSASGIAQPYVKIVFAGQLESPASGFYSPGSGGKQLGVKAPFSQSAGWRAVFVPTKNGVFEFSARLLGDRDWLLLQQPIPCSRWQFMLEAVGRQGSKIWALFLGLSVFLIVLRLSSFLPSDVTGVGHRSSL